MKFVYLLTVSL